MEHPIKQPLATLLEPGHLEHHQASPEGAAKRLSMEGPVKEVDYMHVDPVCVVKKYVAWLVCSFTEKRTKQVLSGADYNAIACQEALTKTLA